MVVFSIPRIGIILTHHRFGSLFSILIYRMAPYIFIYSQGAMLIMAYFMIAGAYWAHKDPTDLKGR